jgi:hypothetical protein
MHQVLQNLWRICTKTPYYINPIELSIFAGDLHKHLPFFIFHLPFGYCPFGYWLLLFAFRVSRFTILLF